MNHFLLIFLTMLLVPFGLSHAAPPPQEGVNNIKIHGSNLANTTEVTVDGVVAPFKVLNDQDIAITVPFDLKDQAKIVIKAPGGQVDTVYQKPKSSSVPDEPLITQTISPSSAPSLGGTMVTIRGSGFKRKDHRLQVTFGGIKAERVNVNSDDMLMVVAPAHAPGAVDVEVKANDATAAKVPNGFIYSGPPTVVTVTPASGPVMGGTLINIKGSGFVTQGDVRVTLGMIPATGVRVKSESEIEAMTPSNTDAPVDVSVTNPDGQVGIAAKAYAYLPAPSVTLIEVSKP